MLYICDIMTFSSPHFLSCGSKLPCYDMSSGIKFRVYDICWGGAFTLTSAPYALCDRSLLSHPPSLSTFVPIFLCRVMSWIGLWFTLHYFPPPCTSSLINVYFLQKITSCRYFLALCFISFNNASWKSFHISFKIRSFFI